MSGLFNELVPVMPPMSSAAAVRLGEHILRVVDPKALDGPCALDLVHWIEVLLPKFGIHVYAGSFEEMPSELGQTDLVDDGTTAIVIREDVDEKLRRPGRIAHQGRSTVLHEIAHAVVHEPILRRRLSLPTVERVAALARTERHKLKAYQDPEWQAWAVAGGMGMPISTLCMLRDRSVENVAAVYRVSDQFAENHLARLRKAELI